MGCSREEGLLRSFWELRCERLSVAGRGGRGGGAPGGGRGRIGGSLCVRRGWRSVCVRVSLSGGAGCAA